MPWIFIRKRRRKRSRPQNTKQYKLYKEATRALVHERLLYWSNIYNFTYKRVAIRNSRSRWGSCSAQKNLNFNYKLLFLPPHLQDYIIVHELCHTQELNHQKPFWDLVSQHIPDYKKRITELRHHERELSASLPTASDIHGVK